MSIDDEPAVLDGGALLDMARRMLGLPQPIAAFEDIYRAHPLLVESIEREES